MAMYYLEVYDEIYIGRPASKFDLLCLDCYHETPAFTADPELEEKNIMEMAFEKFCAGCEEFRFAKNVQLVRIA